MSTYLTIHIFLSVITSMVLCVAGFAALILAIQEHLVRTEPGGNIIRRLPPLITMEKLLFQIITLGFLLLSFLLISSIYYFHELLSSNWLLWQKTILVICAWIVFAMLLIGRYFRGWRGRKAIYGTLFGVTLLIVVYFGSQFVLEGMH
jgi:ABC-type uncharacterized transport system permease subunit